MTKAMWRYYIISSLLSSGKLPKVPATERGVLESLTDQDVEECLQGVPKLALSEMEQTFLNYLRTPDYPMCRTANKGHVISLSMIAERVRANTPEITVASTASWASASISGVCYEDVIVPAVRDSVLVLPTRYGNKKIDLVEAIERAYALYCWGMDNPIEEQKKFVQWCIEFSNPTKSMSLKDGVVTDFVHRCADANIRPADLGRTVLYAHDLRKTVPVAKVPCWWATFDHQLVSVILPQGKGDWVAHARLPFDSFKELASTADGLSSLYVKGGKIVLGGTA